MIEGQPYCKYTQPLLCGVCVRAAVFWITASAIRGLNRRETAAAGSLSYTVLTPSSKCVLRVTYS